MKHAGSTRAPVAGPGTLLDGKYLVGDVIGEGGMSVVVRAVHLARRAPVALKFLNLDMIDHENSAARLLREAIAASAIATEHVVKVYDVGHLPSGSPYLVMELLEGEPLTRLLQRDGTPGLPVPRAIHLILQLLRALQAAHARMIVHRDLKLSNCFVTQFEGEDDFLKVLDFGVSKVRLPDQSALTRTDTRLGTDAFMSPEQAASPGDVTNVADLYSAGIVLYKLLSGSLPFDLPTNKPAALAQTLTSAPVPLTARCPAIAPELAAVVHRAFEREAAARFQSAASLAEALAPWAGERSVGVLQRIRTFERDSRRPKNRGGDVDAILERWRLDREDAEAVTRPGQLAGTPPPTGAAPAPGKTTAAAPEPTSADGARSHTAAATARGHGLAALLPVLVTALVVFAVAYAVIRWLVS